MELVSLPRVISRDKQLTNCSVQNGLVLKLAVSKCGLLVCYRAVDSLK